ncbi:hypothetical protein [Gaetbulibacter saemankumensis]|nr:hypothetical protein [Gaetbulibacter saemankumensis]
MIYLVPEQAKSSESILLPGSLAQHGFGLKTVCSDFGVLTPEYE